MTVVLKQDQTVSGLILTILGLAVSSLLGKNYVGRKLETKLESFSSTEPSNIIEVFLSQNIIFYLAIVIYNLHFLY